MRNLNLLGSLLFAISSILINLSCHAADKSLRVATFNVSIEATNYIARDEVLHKPSNAKVVREFLRSGDHPQIRNIAEIIQRVRPDIVLLNEFDYIADPKEGVQAFIKNYLNPSQHRQDGIDYPHYYVAPVNTGMASQFDLDNDGKKRGLAGDAYGFGLYPGQYGMAILSRYPIKLDEIRTLQHFLWKDMPDPLKPKNTDGAPWYSDEEWEHVRLSSKSHWDIPVETDVGTIHIIAAHPTPPTFDGPEDRNGKRNHDEVRLIKDYISDAPYIYDDIGEKGGLSTRSRFIILGDLNSSPNEGASIKKGIRDLLQHPLVNSSCIPTSKAGESNKPDSEFSKEHTANWGLRVDYALPSNYGLSVEKCGMFWPGKNDPEYRLIETRKASSDHRLVWIDVAIQ